MLSIIPLTFVGPPPDWFPPALKEFVLKSMRGEWTAGKTIYAFGQDELTRFCSIVKDYNPLHTTVGERIAVVPGALVGSILPALVPDIYSACRETGLVIDTGGTRTHPKVLKVGVEIQARVRVDAIQTKRNRAFVDILAEIYSPQTGSLPESVYARIVQGIIISGKKKH